MHVTLQIHECTVLEMITFIHVTIVKHDKKASQFPNHVT